MASGIGVVHYPLPKPGLPTIVVSPGTIAAPAIFVQVTWTGNQKDESAPSPVVGAVLTGVAGVQIALSELGTDIPANASGWNVYAGTIQESLTLQTEAPLSLSELWSVPAQGIVTGRKAGVGQTADLNIGFSKRLQRG